MKPSNVTQFDHKCNKALKQIKTGFFERAPPSSKRRSQKRVKQTSRKIFKQRGALLSQVNTI